jgi:Plavaka transposase
MFICAQMEKKTITVPYQKEDYKYDIWSFDLWEWALQLLRDPFYVSQMRWDALRLFRHNGQTFERFINEPWTANYWWQVQVTSLILTSHFRANER